MAGEWIPIIMFISIAAVLGLWLFFRYRTRQALQETVRVAIEKGHELTPEVLDRLGQPRQSGHADLRRGTISLSIGVALGIFAAILGTAEPESLRPLLGVAAFPTVIGVAYLGLWLFAGKKDD